MNKWVRKEKEYWLHVFKLFMLVFGPIFIIIIASQKMTPEVFGFCLVWVWILMIGYIGKLRRQIRELLTGTMSQCEESILKSEIDEQNKLGNDHLKKVFAYNPSDKKSLVEKEQNKKIYKIVHFEDEMTLGRFYKIGLEREGFEVNHFLNPPVEPKNLIKLIQEEKPDLIIMSIIMPQMDGFVATQILKNNPATKNIPIIGLSNLAQPEDINYGRKLGMRDYITMASIYPIQLSNKLKEFLKDPENYKPIFGAYKE